MHSQVLTLFRVAARHHHHFFLYRLPNSKKTIAMVSFESKPIPKSLFSPSNRGFVVHGNGKETKERAFFPVDILYDSASGHLHYPSGRGRSEVTTDYQKALQQTPLRSPFLEHLEPLSKALEDTDTPQEEFLHNVSICQNHIQKNALKKVVISRQKSILMPPSFDAFTFYESLLDVYPDSFVGLMHSPKLGTWITASPELLLRQNAKCLQTVSLAGSQLHRDTRELYTALWSQKEIEEQALVTKYIIDCFKSIRLREFDYEGPQTIRTGNVLHLKSFFTMTDRQKNTATWAMKILKLLHPTSAVWGSPYDAAGTLIRRLERHDRQYYTGFLGPVNIDESSDIYVNIRTMRLFQTHMVFYAGSGLTRGSIPLSEWQETEWKIHSLFKVVFF